MYYSSANCLFDIGQGTDKKRLRFVYALRVNASHGVMPYHSWSSRNITKFIDGNNIVEGALILNAYIPNYLSRIFTEQLDDLGELGSEQELANSITAELDVAQQILESRVVSIASDEELAEGKPLATLVTKYAPEAALKIARTRAELLKKQTELNTQVYTPTERKYTIDEEYNIYVKQNGNIVDTIESLRFTGKSYEITAGSSMNIKYAFPFVAIKCTI